jgi:hypothetical protein
MVQTKSGKAILLTEKFTNPESAKLTLDEKTREN